MRESPVRGVEQDGAVAGLDQLDELADLLGQEYCDVDEEDGVGVVGVQEGVEAAGHTGLALATWKK